MAGKNKKIIIIKTKQKQNKTKQNKKQQLKFIFGFILVYPVGNFYPMGSFYLVCHFDDKIPT